MEQGLAVWLTSCWSQTPQRLSFPHIHKPMLGGELSEASLHDHRQHCCTYSKISKEAGQEIPVPCALPTNQLLKLSAKIKVHSFMKK